MERYPLVAVAAAAFAALLFAEAGFGQVRRELQVQPQFVPLPLIHIDVTWAAQKLTALLGKDLAIAIFVDEASNTVFVRGSTEKTKQVKEILQRFDVEVQFCIIPLKHVDAAGTAKILSVILTLIALLSDDCESHVTADEKTNSILISATAKRIRQAKEILVLLDAKDK